MASTAVDVSVIIPTFNSEKFIRRSVSSVLEQSDVTVQLIVVDDEGDDATRSILEKVRRDNSARSIVLEYRAGGLGQATARNRGMELSEGRYVTFLDSDDTFMHPGVLADWVKFADRLDLDMAGGQYEHVTFKGISIGARPIATTGDQPVSPMTDPRLVSATSCWQFIYRKNFLDQNKIIFSPRLRQREDRLFLIEAMLKASRIGVMPEAVVRHYGHDESSFKQIDRSQLEQYVQHVRELNAAIAAARTANRVSLDFETANSSIYFNSLYRYWNHLYMELVDAGDAETLISACKAEFKILGTGVASYFDNPLIKDSSLADGSVVEGTTDVLRLAINHDDNAIIRKLLAGQRVSLPELRPLVNDVVAEKIVCRYLSFARDKVVSTVPSSATKPLSQLVSRVIFHVGAPKTGTSSLQHTLESNRLRLIEHGIHYPITGTYREFGIRRERSAGHARLISALLNGELSVLEALCAEVDDLKRPIHTLVLSAENVLSPRFWSSHAGFPLILKRLGMPDVEVVAVLRKQDEWIRSLYIEQTSNPWNKFVDSFNTLVESYASIGLLDYETVLRDLSSSKQVSKVHVGSFEKIQEQGGTVKWFSQVVNFPDFEMLPISSEQSNPSLSEAQAALIKLAKTQQGLERSDLAKVFQLVTGNTSITNGVNVLISERDFEAFRRNYASQISYYCERFGLSDTPRPAPAAPSVTTMLTLPKEVYDLLIDTSHARAPKGASRGSAPKKARPRKIAKTKPQLQSEPAANVKLNGFSSWSLARGFVPKSVGELKAAWLILRSGLFDPQYYLGANSDVATSGMNPLLHFVRYGAYEGRKPNPNLDLNFYLDSDVYAAPGEDSKRTPANAENPLLRYIRVR